MKTITATFIALLSTSLFFSQNERISNKITDFDKQVISPENIQYPIRENSNGWKKGNRKHTPIHIDLINGLSIPKANFQDFVDNGFNTGVVVNKNFCSNLSLGLHINYSSFPVTSNFGQEHINRQNNWSNTTIIVAPQYQISFGGGGIYVYGGSGVSFVNIPEIIGNYPGTDIISTRFNKLSSPVLTGKLGANLVANICRGIQIFAGGEYISGISNNIRFQTRELSEVINDEGNIDPDLASTVPFENKTLKLSTINVNFGIRIALGSNTTKPKTNLINQDCDCNGVKSVNPIYKNKYNQHYKSIDSDDVDKKPNTKAQDYNSSRSNNDGIKGGNDAQDYNSSRSNNDGIKSGNDAQDYNSSRSNNDGIKGDDNAQDYNSSRSNNDGIKGGNDAQDYNSSRSNNDGVKGGNDDTIQNDRAVKTKPVCPKGYTWKKKIGRCVLIKKKGK